MRQSLLKWAGSLACLAIFAAAPAMAGGPHGTYKDAPYMHEATGNWSGIYIGAAVGYSFNSTDLTHDWTAPGPVAVRDTYDMDSDGLTGTLTVGFDRHLNGPLVWGLFADYTFGSMRDRVTLATPGNIDNRLKLEDSWAAGGRLGMVHHGALWYVAAGYTAMDVSFEQFDETLHGYFLGVGLEKDIHPNFRLKFEYRFSSYGSETFYSNAGCCAERVDIESDVHSFRLGLSYVFGHHEVYRHEPLK